jgi:hypothetical protein
MKADARVRHRFDMLGGDTMRIRHAFVTALLTLGIGVTVIAHAEEKTTVKEGVKEAGHAVGSAARTVGQGTKQATKEVGKAVRDVTKETGHAFRDGARELKKGLKGEGEKETTANRDAKEKPGPR